MEISFNIQFQDSVSNERDSLLLEQEEWKENTGYVTKAALYKSLYTSLMGAVNVSSPVECGFNSNGEIETVIHAYPSDKNLNYSLKATYGDFNGRQINIFKEKEIIDFSLTNTASLKYKSDGNLDYHWVGNVYNENSEIVSNLTINIQDSEIKLSEKVYGALSISYNVYRHSYKFIVKPREDEELDIFGAVVYAVYPGGVTWLQLKTPPNSDAIAKGAICGRYVTPSPDEEDKHEVPKFCRTYNKTYTWDYCSKELLDYKKELRYD